MMTLPRINTFVPFIFILVVLLFKVVFSNSVFIAVFIVCMSFFSVYLIFLLDKHDTDLFLVLPLILSSFQNIYLGLIINFVSTMEMQIMLSIHFALGLVALILCIMKYKLTSKPDILYILSLLTTILLYGILLFILRPSSLIGFAASLRNVMNPFIFFIIGALLSRSTNEGRFFRYVSIIGYIIIIFGLFEYLLMQEMWRYFNISDLWIKKGLVIQNNGFPGNFYGSELGQYHRRMVSTYADPVNLGTIMFLIFAVAWYSKRFFLSILSITSIMLIMSKGAILGLLIFFWFYINRRNNFFIKMISSICVASAGLGLVYMAYVNNSGSLFLHLSGFMASIYELPSNLAGHGIGNLGVLSETLSGSSVETDITESGLGMIIGQMGIVGLLIYTFFYIIVYKGATHIGDMRKKILYYSLFFSIILNITFNEVALSPNSSATYFICLGLIFAQKYIKKVEFN